MPDTSQFAGFAALPLHAQLTLALIVGSGIACLAVVAVGALSTSLRQRRLDTLGLPPLPAGFPGALDQLYTALFMGFLLFSAAAQLLHPAAAPGVQAFGWGDMWWGIAAQIAIYLPMLVRYGLVHPPVLPSRPWWQYLALPVLVWMYIYLAVLSLELSGLSPWLIRVTECPEYQELILLFSRGTETQKLYILICAVLVAPVAEECCFRGFLYTTLRRWGGRVAAALASALLFAAIHGSLAQMLPLILFGIAQCIAYEKVRSLWLPIAVHMLFNTTSLIATAYLLP